MGLIMTKEEVRPIRRAGNYSRKVLECLCLFHLSHSVGSDVISIIHDGNTIGSVTNNFALQILRRIRSYSVDRYSRFSAIRGIKYVWSSLRLV